MDNVDTKQRTSQVTVSNGTARYEGDGRSQSFDVIALPDAFVRWQLDYKHSVYDAIERDDYIAFSYPGKRSDNTVDEGGGRVDASALRAIGNGRENGRG